MDYKKDREHRRIRLLQLAASFAMNLPLHPSGLWFLTDLRDNVYYAIHLFAAAKEHKIHEGPEWKDQAEKLSFRILMLCLRLQDRRVDSPTYGHFPMKLSEELNNSSINPMTAEFLGIVLHYFEHQYARLLPPELAEELSEALTHLYRCGAYRERENCYDHHSSKHCALHFIQAIRFGDEVLLSSAQHRLILMIDYARTNGWKEYGSLPWLWHWIQAWDLAWQISELQFKDSIEQLLLLLWNERADFYLRGAWVGAHSRGLPHDVPQDKNQWIDYIHFGDIMPPQQIARLEAAAFVQYTLPEQLIARATKRDQPVEIKRLVPNAKAGHESLHHYVYITEQYALGGMWERTEQFQNEQHRWDISFPADDSSSRVNQAFFFHPGELYADGDFRHESRNQEIVLYRNTIIAGFSLPKESDLRILGVLPPGDVRAWENGLILQYNEAYIIVHIFQSFHMKKNGRCIELESRGRRNAVVMEVLTSSDMLRQGYHDIDDLRTAATAHQPEHHLNGEDTMGIRYASISGHTLELSINGVQGETIRRINGQEVDFSSYSV
jgi:hypothetical protein